MTDNKVMRTLSTGCSPFAILNVFSPTGPPKEIAGSARGVNRQGRDLPPSIAAVRAGPSGRAPIFSSNRCLAGFTAGSTPLAKNDIQGVSSESSLTGRSHELQIPGTHGGRTWVKWALPLSLFTPLARQSAWWSCGMSTIVPPLPSAAAAPPVSDLQATFIEGECYGNTWHY